MGSTGAGTGARGIGSFYPNRAFGVPVEDNAVRMCELLVDLPDVTVVALGDEPGSHQGDPSRVQGLFGVVSDLQWG